MNSLPLGPDELYNIAQQLAASGKYDEAVEAYSSAISCDPRHVASRCARGLVFQRTGKHAEAIADFDRALLCNQDWPGAYVAYFGRAGSRLALGQQLEAVDDCDEAIERSPRFTEALYLRATLRKSMGQFDAAVSDLNAVLKIDPSHREALFVRGGLHFLQRCGEEAIADLTMAIEHGIAETEYSETCFYLRGMASQELGEHRAAIADFARTIELIPNDAAAYLRRSRSYHELGQSALADADFQAGALLTKAR